MTETLLHIIRSPLLFWKPMLEVVLLAAIIYVIIRFLQGTRGAGILRGLTFIVVLVLVFLFFVSLWLDLPVILWILEKLMPFSLLVILIIFQPEIRRGLIQLGQHPFFAGFNKSQGEVLNEIVKSVVYLSEKNIGALIAIERDSPLKAYVDAGVKLESQITAEALNTIFYPGTALHDGAVIIRDKRIAAAGCLFPLTDDPDISKSLGTRHRAGIGITEESDAITVIVSEETGKVSVGVRGKLTQGLNRHALGKMLQDLCSRELDIPEHFEAE